jgi:hypothetical protein
VRAAGDEDGGLGECAEEYLLRDLVDSAADLLQQVVGLVGDQEGIEVRPTSRFFARVAVGRTSINRLA